MKQIPILYSAPMVQAYFAGKKEQTRRPRGLEEINKEPDKWRFVEHGKTFGYFFQSDTTLLSIKCPYGQAGDVLVGREKWATISCEDDTPPNKLPPHSPIWYEDTPGDEPTNCGDDRGKWRPSMFMPLEFSRIHQTLLADPVPQRLWDMTEEDFEAEGVELTHTEPEDIHWYRPAYTALWNSHYGKTYPWESNPWAWKLVFPRYG